MRDDQIVLRLMLMPTSSGRTVVTAMAFTFWLDDAAPNGAQVLYASDERGDGFKPLQLRVLPSNTKQWPMYVSRLTAGWPTRWMERQKVVCVKTKPVGHTVPPSLPEVLTHLARFEGQARETARHTDGYSAVSYNIVADRLNGLGREGLSHWKNVIGK